MRTRCCILLVMVFSLLLASCSAKDPICESHLADPAEAENVCGMGVTPGAASAELRLQVKLTGGVLEWSLEDPQGVVRWQGSAAAGEDVDLTRSFSDPFPGRWNLRLRLDGATGDYQAPWVVK